MTSSVIIAMSTLGVVLLTVWLSKSALTLAHGSLDAWPTNKPYAVINGLFVLLALFMVGVCVSTVQFWVQAVLNGVGG